MTGDSDHEVIVDRCIVTAARTAVHAGTVLRSAFLGDTQVEHKSSVGDYTSSADRDAEELVVGELLHAFPEHEIRSEEAGIVKAGGPWRWLVDPLDGTHNYLCGIPLYGVVLSLFFGHVPEACVIHDAHVNRTVIAKRGRGIRIWGDRRRELLSDISRMTMSVIRDYPRDRTRSSQPHDRNAIPPTLGSTPERILDLWAPCIDAILFATRSTGVLVAHGWSGAERFAVLLAATEVGGIATDWFGQPIDLATPPPRFVILQPELASATSR